MQLNQEAFTQLSQRVNALINHAELSYWSLANEEILEERDYAYASKAFYAALAKGDQTILILSRPDDEMNHILINGTKILMQDSCSAENNFYGFIAQKVANEYKLKAVHVQEDGMSNQRIGNELTNQVIDALKDCTESKDQVS